METNLILHRLDEQKEDHEDLKKALNVITQSQLEQAIALATLKTSIKYHSLIGGAVTGGIISLIVALLT